MRYKRPLIAILFLVSLGSLEGYGQSNNLFSGFYGGVEGGAISYNTQITFDGVDDPAGRGGGGYGVFGGYNYAPSRLLLGAELYLNTATIPDPYTFDPNATGFSELDLRRGASYGLDIRLGYVVLPWANIFGSLGYSLNRQSVRIDGTPLDQFQGGSSAESYGALQLGAGMEAALGNKIGARFSFKAFSGVDLDASDFGSIPIDASLSRFDVEPEQLQFFFGLIYFL